MEKVVKNNFFHHFREKKLPQKFVEKVQKGVKTNFFHDSSRFGGRNRGKSCFQQLLPPFLYGSKDFLNNSWKKWKKMSKTTFSATQAVLEAEIVEKVVFDNFFHHLYDSKDFLNNSWKKWRKLAWPTFSTTISIAFGG